MKPKKVLNAIYLLIASQLIGFLNSFVVNGFSISFIKLLSILFTFSMMMTLIYFINYRKNWARIILLILLLFGIVILLMRIIKTFSIYPITESIALISSIFQAIAVILLFSKESNNWYNHKNETN